MFKYFFIAVKKCGMQYFQWIRATYERRRRWKFHSFVRIANFVVSFFCRVKMYPSLRSKHANAFKFVFLLAAALHASRTPRVHIRTIRVRRIHATEQ